MQLYPVSAPIGFDEVDSAVSKVPLVGKLSSFLLKATEFLKTGEKYISSRVSDPQAFKKDFVDSTVRTRSTTQANLEIADLEWGKRISDGGHRFDCASASTSE